MKVYAKMKLWEVCLHKPSFRIELEKVVSQTTDHEIFDVLKYCYDKYSDMHADVLLDVFSKYRKSSRKEIEVHAESDKRTGVWN